LTPVGRSGLADMFGVRIGDDGRARHEADVTQLPLRA
jgi:hypothetical protein